MKLAKPARMKSGRHDEVSILAASWRLPGYRSNDGREPFDESQGRLWGSRLHVLDCRNRGVSAVGDRADSASRPQNSCPIMCKLLFRTYLESMTWEEIVAKRLNINRLYVSMSARRT